MPTPGSSGLRDLRESRSRDGLPSLGEVSGLSLALCGSSGCGGLALFTCYPLFGCSHFPVLSSHPHLFINLSLLSHSHLLLWVEPFPSPELPTSPQFSQYAMFFSTFQFLSPSYIFSFSSLSISLF